MSFSKYKHYSLIIFITLSCFFSICLSVILFNNSLLTKLEVFCIIFITIFISISCLYGYFSKRILIYKLFLIFNIIAFVALVFVYLSNKYELFQYFTSTTILKNIILSSGAMGLTIFLLVQIAQVVFLPIPSVLLIIVGSIIYGPVICAIVCSVGVIIGSLIAFALGKVFGLKFAKWLIGENKSNYYFGLLKGREKFFLSFAFIFPFFPDDILCMVAGMTTISFKDFLKITILTRPLGIISLCLFGSTIYNLLNKYLWIILTICIILSVILWIFYKFIYKTKLQNNKNIILIKRLVFKK